MGPAEITQFLSALAVQHNVAASTQNQALSALLFLYRNVLEQELPWLEDVVRARKPVRLPVVLTRDEVRAVIRELDGRPGCWPCSSTAPVCASWRRRGSGSRTWTLPGTSWWCAAARATGTG